MIGVKVADEQSLGAFSDLKRLDYLVIEPFLLKFLIS
jgi:hypothetical protein